MCRAYDVNVLNFCKENKDVNEPGFVGFGVFGFLFVWFLKLI